MGGTIVNYVARRLLPAAGVCFGMLLLVPTVTRASCGDYLTDSGPMSAVTFLTASPFPEATLSAPEADRRLDRPSGPRPCHGPNCRSAPAVPMTPPAAPVLTLSNSQWGLPALERPPLSQAAGSILLVAPPRFSSGHWPRIDRPPTSLR